MFSRLICGFKCVQTRLSNTVFPQKSFIYWFYQSVMMWPMFIIFFKYTNGVNKILSLLQYLLTRVFALTRISLIKYLVILSYSFCRKGRENAWFFFRILSWCLSNLKILIFLWFYFLEQLWDYNKIKDTDIIHIFSAPTSEYSLHYQHHWLESLFLYVYIKDEPTLIYQSFEVNKLP